MTLLAVAGLKVQFRGGLRAVQDVGFELAEGESLGLVGESGCGKSTTALALLGLLPGDARVEAQTLRYDGRELLSLPESERRGLRGRGIAMVFQDPVGALNPVRTIGSQMVEVLRRQHGLGAGAALNLAADWLHRVGLPDPPRRLSEYPHQLSGGQCQRVMIALALACQPRLLIADEPTSALDVTLQAQILQLLRRLTRETGTAMLLITHDLSIVAETCERVAVMYAGRIVEEGAADAIFVRPLHPYTEALLSSRPQLHLNAALELPAIPGVAPQPGEAISGCAFHPRCRMAMPHCAEHAPRMERQGRRTLACHLSALSDGSLP